MFGLEVPLSANAGYLPVIANSQHLGVRGQGMADVVEPSICSPAKGDLIAAEVLQRWEFGFLRLVSVVRLANGNLLTYVEDPFKLGLLGPQSNMTNHEIPRSVMVGAESTKLREGQCVNGEERVDVGGG